ncbi:MAG: EF-hand domain-containing protein [Sandaracinus sp.]
MTELPVEPREAPPEQAERAPRPPREVTTESRAAFVDQRLWTGLQRAFRQHAGTDLAIDAADLQRALGLKSRYLAERLLARFDRDKDGVVRYDDFLDGVQRLVLGSDQDKLRFAFRLHDHDDDGRIDRVELTRMIALSLAESEVVPHDGSSAEELAKRLLWKADTDRDGAISFEELEAVARAHPEILERMTRSEALWIVPSEDILARLEPRTPPSLGTRVSRYASNHLAAIVVLAIWVFANVVVLGGTFAASEADPWMAVGSATGHAVSMNVALLLLPVLRRLVTRLRALGLARLVPLDQGIDFHAIAARAAFVLALVHTLAYLGAHWLGHPEGSLVSMLTTTRRGLTGLVLGVAFVAIGVGAVERVRRSQRFELFFQSHLFYGVWLLAAVVHEPRSLVWLGLPVFGLLVEQLVRARRRGVATIASEARALRSGVTELVIEKPAGFHFEPGDYLFLNVPAIAKHEWHPFTISSPPEDDSLTVHVRSLGNWTKALRAHVEQRERAAASAALVVHLDGPYGSPTAHLFRSRHAVLVGAGIGVTPFASVLSSFLRRAGTERAAKLEKGYFVWLNRDQYSFEWFADVLADVERRDTERLFDLGLYMTAGQAGATATALEAARVVSHDEGASDLVTGLRTQTKLGAPDWRRMLREIHDRHAPARVDVFFCGPPGLGAKIRAVCRELDLAYHEERF